MVAAYGFDKYSYNFRSNLVGHFSKRRPLGFLLLPLPAIADTRTDRSAAAASQTTDLSAPLVALCKAALFGVKIGCLISRHTVVGLRYGQKVKVAGKL
ncbi:uncharacterized protein N7443_005649 [Penicillium atrosanguineum]|uniref:uncharacterized protein n=1 Tax=Penicillium atrosanguineum TaxID=1132637 RepID=UPI00238CA96C|nr:uncharacterized protein N7443_005649 [Penicillium atrosanguineum]KAJ5128527.1 hypothetical protein N7526_006693 [Penicillium atrosanguineum]KAJ5300647.1 hypothetical protein N7443_005649 [Penicillium atrosanguineum]